MVIIRTFAPRPIGSPTIVQAMIDRGKWSCGNFALERKLNLLHLPAGYFPDPDRTLAGLAIQLFGGEIVADHPARDRAPAGTVF